MPPRRQVAGGGLENSSAVGRRPRPPFRSANPDAAVYISRRRVNDAFLRAALESFHKDGPAAFEKCARENPASYLKIFALLVPRELKIEHANPVSGLSDEQLAQMIAELEERIAAKLSGEEAKVINESAATDLTALLPPANEGLCETTGRRKRDPSTPERLAYAREYKRQRKAGNPNAAAAARAAAQAAKTNK